MMTDSKCFSLSINSLCLEYSLVQRRGFHTSPIVPVKTYDNADGLKELAIKENKGKSGVYR